MQNKNVLRDKKGCGKIFYEFAPDLDREFRLICGEINGRILCPKCKEKAVGNEFF